MIYIISMEFLLLRRRYLLLQNAPHGEEQGQRQLYSYATVRDYIPKLDLSPRAGALVKNIVR